MKKKEIKNMLIEMRKTENEANINYLLGKIDMMEEKEIEEITKKFENDTSKIKELLISKLQEIRGRDENEKIPINEMFTYGITGNCVHLHLPIDLHKSMSKNGIKKTIALVNLYMLDAIERLKEMKNDGYYKFKYKDNIYMISPAMIKSELKILEKLGFDTRYYKKNDLKRQEFINKNEEAALAEKIFGKDRDIGVASITFDKINTNEYKEKKDNLIKEINDKGITIDKKYSEIMDKEV